MTDPRDEVIARMRREIVKLMLARELPSEIVSVFGYPIDKILELIEEHEEKERMANLPKLRISEIVQRTCEETGVSPDAIYSRCRTHAVSRARHLAMRRVYDLGPEWSMPRVGRHFKRDHTTVLHALRRYPKGS